MGVDEKMNQTVHARSAYTADDILFDQQFADVVRCNGAGRLVIDFAHFGEVVTLRLPPGD